MGVFDFFKKENKIQKPSLIKGENPIKDTSNSNIKDDVYFVLANGDKIGTPYTIGGEAPIDDTELRNTLTRIQNSGDKSVSHIISAIIHISVEGYEIYWWKSARELCKLLSRIGTPIAEDGLLKILQTDSKFAEFDGVRAESAIQLSTFQDTKLVAKLRACLTMPNAPIVAISDTIEKLGDNASDTPDVIMERGEYMEPKKAIAFFSKYEKELTGWTPKERGYFYRYAAPKVEAAFGKEEAKPLWAASVLANPEPNAVGWRELGITIDCSIGKDGSIIWSKTTTELSEMAQKLSNEYPLPEGYLSRLK